MASKDHQQLMHVLNRMAKTEQWQRMAKKQGKIIQKSTTAGGNFKLVLKTKKGEENVYILKKNKNIYATAEQLQEGDVISVALRRYLGKMYCTKLAKRPARKTKAYFVAESGTQDLQQWITR